MFVSIFSFEFKRWLRNTSFYIYIALFFVLAFFTAASSMGVFDSVTVTTASNAKANSPIALNNLINGLSIFIYFLLPTIIGASVYRDFKYNTHTILFSYPFSKISYLAGKFLSSLCIVILITLFVGIATYVASWLPWANAEMLTEYKFSTYIHIYLVYIIPNLILYGAIVFALVTFSRNVYVGFISIVLLLVVQGLLENLTQDIDNRYLVALLEPFGSEAFAYYTRYWTIAEQNENPLPFEGAIIYNRLIWLGVASLILSVFYYYFSFTQSAFVFGRSKKAERLTKQNFGGITRVVLPEANHRFSFIDNLKTAFFLARQDFVFVVRNWSFISILVVGLVFILITSTVSGQILGTKTSPVTWQMLLFSGGIFSLFINLLTFLFAGLLVHRGTVSRMGHLIDSTPIPNWALLLSKLVALVKMQVVLLLVILLSGILIQVYHGYYRFELGHYLFELFGINLIHFVIWAFLAILIQTLVKNYLLGFFITLALSIAINFLDSVGVEQMIFKFNQAPGIFYSDMNGYGHTLPRYYFYKLYWALLGIVLTTISFLFWRRGITQTAKERLAIAKKRLTLPVAGMLLTALAGFLSISAYIYYESKILNPYVSAKEQEQQQADWEKKYKKYQHKAQPRITDVNVTLHLIPERRSFTAQGYYLLKNKTAASMDSVLVIQSEYENTLTFSKPFDLLLEDTIYNLAIYKLKTPLAPGDSIKLSFQINHKPNTILTNHSGIISNGTFINSATLFPSLGYNEGYEITNDDIRKKYGLEPKERMAAPDDSLARRNTYISRDADWVTFETVVSTAPDQIAIAPGYLVREWVEKGRNYFHYKMDRPMLNFYAFNSARYEVRRAKWNDINIEIYHHKGHEYNLDRMVEGVQKSLAYYSENFSPYQHKQARIIEFPRTYGTFAQSFANTIPFSEAVGFIADVDDADENAVDYPFTITSHEVAHQWWAHQVIGADVQGATLLSESLSEYSSLKVLEQRYGKGQMRKFLKDALDKYLQGRTFEGKKEKPLMYNENQQYIHYNKGSLVLYALSDYIGDSTFNQALKEYVSAVAFQEAPYTNSIELVAYFKKATPDSLHYLIEDMFETITVYDNKLDKAVYKDLGNGKYQVDIEVQTTKYRSDDKGKRIFENDKGETLTWVAGDKKKPVQSYPLSDYVEIGIFGEEEVEGKKKEKILYLEKVKVTAIKNTYSIVVDGKPTEAGVDPYNKLIDIRSDDNRLKM
jgi:ABC-2 type transport system permease protein